MRWLRARASLLTTWGSSLTGDYNDNSNDDVDKYNHSIQLTMSYSSL